MGSCDGSGCGGWGARVEVPLPAPDSGGPVLGSFVHPPGPCAQVVASGQFPSLQSGCRMHGEGAGVLVTFSLGHRPACPWSRRRSVDLGLQSWVFSRGRDSPRVALSSLWPAHGMASAWNGQCTVPSGGDRAGLSCSRP